MDDYLNNSATFENRQCSVIGGVDMLHSSKEFILLATHLNYSKVARMMNMSKSSLSRHIKDMEKSLGFKVFDRNPLSLTPAGKQYLESLSDIILRFDNALEEARLLDRQGTPSITVSIIHMQVDSQSGPHATIVYRALNEIQNVYPNLQVNFIFDKNYTIQELVQDSKADVGILFGKPEVIQEGYNCDLLTTVSLGAWLHEDNPLSKQHSVTFADLANNHLVRPTNLQFDTYHNTLVSLFFEQGLNVKTRLKDLTNLTDTAFSLRPDEFSIGPDLGEPTIPYNSRVTRVEFVEPKPIYPIYLYYSQKPENELVNSFIKACFHAVEKLNVPTP